MLPLPEVPSLVLFVGAALVLLLTPGPAVMYIVARGVHQGRQAGVVSALAVGLGNFVHALAATLGLSALLLSSSLAFTMVKYAGAAYLIYIGVRATLGVCSDSLYGLLAGSLSGWLRRSTGALRRGRYATVTVYLGLGLTAAVAEPQR